MYDSFNRHIYYLRISVTDKCNYRCSYCMPDGVPLVSHKDILSFEEIAEVVKVAVQDFGFYKIRLTGGEPTVRRDIVSLVSMISTINGISDFGMTTNGSRLEQLAKPLKEAGLHRVNVSLDSVDPEEYARITETGELDTVLRGIFVARDVGLSPIKLNCVIKKTPEESAAQGVAKWGATYGFAVRFIRQMDLARGLFWQVIGGDGGNCAECGRLRLSARGDLFPCLFSDVHFNVRKLGVSEALRLAVLHKPERGDVSHLKAFYTIGG